MKDSAPIHDAETASLGGAKKTPCPQKREATSAMFATKCSALIFVGRKDQGSLKLVINATRWWFQRFFIFTPIGGKFPF